MRIEYASLIKYALKKKGMIISLHEFGFFGSSAAVSFKISVAINKTGLGVVSKRKNHSISNRLSELVVLASVPVIDSSGDLGID